MLAIEEAMMALDGSGGQGTPVFSPLPSDPRTSSRRQLFICKEPSSSAVLRLAREILVALDYEYRSKLEAFPKMTSLA